MKGKTILENTKTNLSEKDRKFREFALNGNMWKVILYVCLPLSFFQLFSFLFNILYKMMASHISSTAVSAVAYLSQLQNIVSAVGSGLAVGSTLKISEAYGAGDYDMVKKRMSSLIAICFGIAAIIIAMLPFTPFLLRMSGTPTEFIDIGTKYFMITMFATVISFFNNVYIAIERSRGNSRRILHLNIGVMTVKLILTALFVYVLNGDITTIAIATVISQSCLLIIAARNLCTGNDAFTFSLKSISLKKIILVPMISISFPVIMEKIAFALGKTVINGMSASYGSTTVGALGISNNINGIDTNLQNGFQDGGASVISQNRGAGNIERSLDAFKKILVFNIFIGFFGWLLLNIFINQISFPFANSVNGMDYEFQNTIIKVFRYDSFGSCLPLGINCSIMALLFGFGKTKLTLLINFCRVFVFRIPVLWALQNFTSLGSESVGIVMATSNVFTAILSSVIAVVVIHNIKKSHD